MVHENKKSRYAVICPVCGKNFRPVQFSFSTGTFRCLNCGELLQYTRENIWVVLPISVAAAIILALYLGYGGVVFGVVTFFAASVIFFLGIGIAYQVRPPGVRQGLRDGDAGLRLTDKPRR
jgi:hypothetical protein